LLLLLQLLLLLMLMLMLMPPDRLSSDVGHIVGCTSVHCPGIAVVEGHSSLERLAMSFLEPVTGHNYQLLSVAPALVPYCSVNSCSGSSHQDALHLQPVKGLRHGFSDGAIPFSLQVSSKLLLFMNHDVTKAHQGAPIRERVTFEARLAGTGCQSQVPLLV